MTKLVVNIRGTNGSGKSEVVRRFIKRYVASLEELDNLNPPKDSRIETEIGPIYIIGSYKLDGIGGGTDSINRTPIGIKGVSSSQDEICRRIIDYSKKGHVLFEGLIASGIYGRYASLDEELTKLGCKYVWSFLDTPVETCIERTKKRRDSLNQNRKPFDPKNLIAKFRSISNVLKKVRTEKRNVVLLSGDDPLPGLLKIFGLPVSVDPTRSAKLRLAKIHI